MLRFRLDAGDGEDRQILSGIAKFYPNEQELVGKKLQIVANLKPRKMMKKYVSQGMILSAEHGDQLTVLTVDPSKERKKAMIFVILVTGLYTFLFVNLNHLRMVFVSSVLMFNNWWQIDKGALRWAEAPFSHFYSLAIAQFYLVWPVVCLFLIRKCKR